MAADNELADNQSASSKGSSNDSGPNECNICLDSFEAGDLVRQLWCGHMFHQQCVEEKKRKIV